MGDEPSRLLGLLDLLRSTYGTGAKLGVDEIEPFLGEAGGVPPWELTDAIDRGDRALALELLHRMLGQGERHPFQVLATLHAPLGPHAAPRRRRRGATRRRRPSCSASRARRSRPARRSSQARKLGHDRIVRMLDLLAEADLDLRGGKAWPDDLVLEVLVARLATMSPLRRGRLAQPAAVGGFASGGDLRRAAAFLWITPLVAALSMRFTAALRLGGGVVGPGLGGGDGRLRAGLQLAAHGLVALGALDVLPVALDLALDVGHGSCRAAC